ncbi:6167_t:CDS:2 [Entrophospora sp. SA101]|nr:7784_t:CDS:2 [Entrophospora sp. SA101]CAJ0835388.1 6167_t:CDS:2 [Entrophospora sp. SA101]
MYNNILVSRLLKKPHTAAFTQNFLIALKNSLPKNIIKLNQFSNRLSPKFKILFFQEKQKNLRSSIEKNNLKFNRDSSDYYSYIRYYTTKNPEIINEEPIVDWITLSFYSFTSFPENSLNALREKLLTNLTELGILGRIYVASEGINAQISCPKDKLNKLRKFCDEEMNLKTIEFNYATLHEKAFRKLNVKIRKQIVADGLESGSFDLSKQPKHLEPEEWHFSLTNAKKSSILIDMRNHYESEIGYFESSIKPDVDTFRDSIIVMNEICKGKQNHEIYMYCTGGIRCSKAGSILISNGFKHVNVLKGGITAYGRFIASNPSINSLFKGRNFTFDKRLGEPITNDVVAQCHTCGKPCDRYTNCRNKACNLLFIQCQDCRDNLLRTCGTDFCFHLVKAWDEKFGRNQKFDDIKPGLECIYDHVHRTRPRLVIERLGGNVINPSKDLIKKILEQDIKQLKH